MISIALQGSSLSMCSHKPVWIYRDTRKFDITFFTTTCDSLGEIDPDINQCLNGRSHQCGEYDQDYFTKTFKECKSLSIIHTNIGSTKKNFESFDSYLHSLAHEFSIIV